MTTEDLQLEAEAPDRQDGTGWVVAALERAASPGDHGDGRARAVRPGLGTRARALLRRLRGLWRWDRVGFVMTGTGILLCLLLVYLYAFTPLSWSRSQHRLIADFNGDRAALLSLAKGNLPPEGAPVAMLRIPSIGQRAVIVEGSSATDLQRGPGLVRGSALPGDLGNAVLAGRSVTFGAPFGRLDELHHGARVLITDGAGSFAYRVVRVVTAGTGHVTSPGKAQGWLTLVTSQARPGSSGHVVAIARLQGSPSPGTTLRARGLELPRLDLSGDPWGGLQVLLWGAAFFAALWAGIRAMRRWEHSAVVYLLGIPIVLACGLLTSENIARLLPATF